jgi:HAD superfamily hydrolase (TIGR01509 family)
VSADRFALVIFDCDGVLVDSEFITNRIFARMLNELGVSVTLADMFETYVGRSMRQCIETIERQLGHSVPESFLEQYHARTTAAFRAELRAVAGVEAALNAITIPCCVASSGSREKMATTLGITGLYPRFRSKLFSADDVAKGKPAPDIFLHAAKCSGVAPQACAVIEDSPAGVAGAVAAGMTVYGYCASTPEARLLAAGAHYTFSSMSKLPGLLGAAIELPAPQRGAR